MILKEIAVERFTFTCCRCDHAWTVDYDVQHVEDGHGHLHDYFYRNGLSIIDPTAPHSVVCPTCRTTRVQARLNARRTTPAVNAGTAAALSTKPNAQLTAEREQAAPLLGDQTPR